jgi:hypothetical protein
LIILQ